MPDLVKSVEEAYQILMRHNLVGSPSPASGQDQQPVSAEKSTISLTCRNVTEVRRSLAFPSVRAERARNICSISVSLEVPRAARIDEKTFLENFAAILRSLPALKELSIIGYDTPHTPSRDIFGGCMFNLEKLHCDSNKLLVASWNSVGQSSIRDFRGFTNFVTEGPPSEIQPRDMANLKHLETSAYFAERLTTPAKVTHISLHTSRSKTKDTLWYLSNLLGDQLVSLRVNRTLVASKSPPLEDVEKADTNGLLWASDSPLMICCMLRAPNLTYLEIRDTSLKVSREPSCQIGGVMAC